MAGSQPLPLSRPMSVKDIADKAHFEFNPSVALKYWLRTADTLLREAHIYEQEQNNQQAYLLLMRYATLITTNLPSHPEARTPEYRTTVRNRTKSLPDVLDRLEALKPKIEARYKQWQQALERRREASLAVDHERSRSQVRNDFAASDPAVAGNSTTLAAADHEDIAVKVAHKEIRRRDAARKATRQAGVSAEEEQERRTAGLWDDWEAALSRDSKPVEDRDLQESMEATRRRLDGAHDMVPDGVRRRLSKHRPVRVSSAIINGNDYRYPSISKPKPFQYDEVSADSRISTPRPDLPPSKPPKEPYVDLPAYSASVPPPLPSKVSPEPLAAEIPDESLPKAGYTFQPAAYLENGNPLRTVFINPTLRKTFLEYAAANTRANLETCGMLCGTLISNALFISKLVIPEQESTSDTCETVNESALFDYCASEDLMVLGWIHTHPTQTCFMSSRDLHTHCGYQVMMPESIAIVCAPTKNPSWGCFRLTDPPGMKSVLNCRQTGLFHPHEQNNIYTDALRPGHVYEAPGLDYAVVDLRP